MYLEKTMLINFIGTITIVALVGMFVMWMLGVLHLLVIGKGAAIVYQSFYYISATGLIVVYFAYPLTAIGRGTVSYAELYAILGIMTLCLVIVEILDRIAITRVIKGYSELATMTYHSAKIFILMEIVYWSAFFTGSIP